MAASTLKCRVCSESGDGSKTYDSGHFKGAAHLEACAKMDGQGNEQRPDASQRFVCIPCGTFANTSKDAAIHNAAARHASRLGLLAEEAWHCETCNVNCSSELHLKAHLNLKTHITLQNRLARGAARSTGGPSAGTISSTTVTGDASAPKVSSCGKSVPDNIRQACELCNWCSDSVKAVVAHFRAHRHWRHVKLRKESGAALCGTCGVVFQNGAQRTSHYRGKDHQNHTARVSGSSNIKEKSSAFKSKASRGALGAAAAAGAASAAGFAAPASITGREAERRSVDTEIQEQFDLSDATALDAWPKLGGPDAVKEEPCESNQATQHVLGTASLPVGLPDGAGLTENPQPPVKSSCASCAPCGLTLPCSIALAQHRGKRAHQLRVHQLLRGALGEIEAASLIAKETAPIGAIKNAPDLEDLFTCPISHEVMVNPAMAADGYTYERANIADWLVKSNVSPMTGEALPNQNLIGNASLRAIIQIVR